MLYKLLKFHFSQGHQPLDLATWAIEVLDTEGIDSDHLDAALVANLEHLSTQDTLVVGGGAKWLKHTLARASKPRW